MVLTKEKLDSLDREFDEHFAEMGEDTEGYLAFLVNDNEGREVRLDALETSLLDEDRLKCYGQKIQGL